MLKITTKIFTTFLNRIQTSILQSIVTNETTSTQSPWRQC